VINVSTEGSMPLDAHKKRRLRKAESSGFVFRELVVDSLPESYQLIVASRLNKAYPVTMTLEQLHAMFVLFPNAYRLFGLLDHDTLVATAVCIKVSTEILYCFYIGDHLAYRSLSPVTALVNGIYSYCQSHNFRMLDLGISTDKGILNSGLYNFKKTFGSIKSDKLTFSKTL
jgi:lipid II:glycine glycyltransferase (peptidoglycan interpeptide bridge formation enzyme)